MNNIKWCSGITGHCEEPHIFADIEGLNPQCYDPGTNYEDKKRAIMSSWMQEFSPCMRCYDGLCRIPQADFGVSGLPCTDMSRAGLRRMRHGPTNGVYMTHAKYNKRCRTPLFVVECTPEPQRMTLHKF